MKILIAYIASLIVATVGSFTAKLSGRVLPPEPTSIASAEPSATPLVKPQPTLTPTPTLALNVVATPKPANIIKTPTVSLSPDVYAFVVAMRPGESVRVTTIRPPNGERVTGIIIGDSGAPSGVSVFATGETEKDVYIRTSASALPGSYTWKPSMKVSFSAGPDNSISPVIKLTIYGN